MKLRLLLICLLLSVAPAASALQPYRVADLDPTFHSVGSSPDNFVRVGQRVVFTATTPNRGLWSSDGTTAGTVRLVGNQTSFANLAATGEVLFFRACGPQRCRLQVTDGTVAGTRVLPGSPSIFLSQIAIAGGRRIFFSGTGSAASELWTSDGTPGGTRLVKRFGPGSPAAVPYNFVWFRGRLWFFQGDALWTSDGQAAGTRKIATVGSSIQFAVAGSRLVFFAGPSGSHVHSLWSSDGTAQGTKIFAAVPKTGDFVVPLVSAGRNSFLLVPKSASSQQQIWVTDGTATNTRKLATFEVNDITYAPVVVGSRVVFIARDNTHGQNLWVSDGTPAGTRWIIVCPACRGVESIGAVDGGRLWFAGTSPNAGEELWTSDGTQAGTRLVKDLTPGPQSSDLRNFFAAEGRVYFVDGPGDGTVLWASDGTAGGTRRLVGEDDPFASSLGVSFGASAGGRAFFRLTDEAHGPEPWVSDGTVAGTSLVADLNPAQESSSFPQVLMPAGDRCFFFVRIGDEESYGLWVSDGTAAGTSLVHPFESPFFEPNQFVGVDLGDRLAWFQKVGSPPGEIWISDGTPAETFRLHSSELRAGGPLRSVAGQLVFEAEDAEHGGELWRSDGTPEGAVRLTDFANSAPFPAFLDPQPRGFFEIAGGVGFFAADASGHFEPWFSDGTIGGTRHLADVYPALVAPFAELSSDVVSMGGRIFFISGTAAPALWVSDLTAAGTRNLGPVVTPGGNPAAVSGLAAVNGRVLVFYTASGETGFRSSDGTTFGPGALVGLAFGAQTVAWGDRLAFQGETATSDDELYVTDGTAAGTTRLTYPDGSGISSYGRLAVLGGRLAFAAPTLGVWDTDGTPAGTVRRLAPYAGVFTQEIIRAGERIFFPWYDAQAGTELWALRP
ncbi:MAG TPA: hypothetical protein VGS22_11220 [Thermoanaerobaculia bacterium]|jgi:ELWxxDGT repeat protein|nr:hypothetical protein [Thermoanaerobaculia bacterium]